MTTNRRVDIPQPRSGYPLCRSLVGDEQEGFSLWLPTGSHVHDLFVGGTVDGLSI